MSSNKEKQPAESDLQNSSVKRVKTEDDTSEEGQQKSVFISGLPRRTTKETLDELFAEVGPVISHDIAARAGGTIAFVEFDSVEIARAAIKISGSFIEGSKVNIQSKRNQGGAAAKVGKQKSNTIFIKFMEGSNMSALDVQEAFNVCNYMAKITTQQHNTTTQLCGGIKDLRMHNSRLYCFVEFHKLEAATVATQIEDPRFQVHYSQQSSSTAPTNYSGSSASVRAKVEASKSKPASMFKPRTVIKKKS